jgi:hypothetical protein
VAKSKGAGGEDRYAQMKSLAEAGQRPTRPAHSAFWTGNRFPGSNTGAVAERSKLTSGRVEREIKDHAQDSKSRQQIHLGSKTKTGAEKKKDRTPSSDSGVKKIKTRRIEVRTGADQT